MNTDFLKEKFKNKLIWIKYDGWRENKNWTIIGVHDTRIGDFETLEEALEALNNEK